MEIGLLGIGLKPVWTRATLHKPLLQDFRYLKAFKSPQRSLTSQEVVTRSLSEAFLPAAGGGPAAGRPLPPVLVSALHLDAVTCHLRRFLPRAAISFSRKKPKRFIPQPF